jgi:hypothetical protein
VRRLELEAEEHGEQRRRGGGRDRGVELPVKRGLRSVARCGAPPTPCPALRSGMRWLWAPGGEEQRRKRNGGNPTTSLMQSKPIFLVQPIKQTHNPTYTKRSEIAKRNLCMSWAWPVWLEPGSQAWLRRCILPNAPLQSLPTERGNSGGEDGWDSRL